MRNAGLDEEQAGIKFARRNINNRRFVDDTKFMVENGEKKKNASEPLDENERGE